MARSKAGSPKIRSLGAELRKLRQENGMNVRELARRLNRPHAWIVRTEAGDRAASPEEVAEILVTLGVTAHERDRIVELAREGDGPDWLRTGIPGVHQELVTLIEYERTANVIHEVAPLLVPGLLQTADYARAVMTGLPSGEVESRVAMRANRRDALTSRGAPQLGVFILETALTTPIADPEVMADQYRYLVRMAELSNITVNVIPADVRSWTPAHSGQFMLFEFAKARPIVHLEQLGSAAFLTSPSVVETYSRALDTLRESALSPGDSREFIASCVERGADSAEAATNELA